MTTNSYTAYRIDEPDFKAGQWKESRHNGKRVWICTCYELSAGRWEGFVSMSFTQPKN